METMTCLPSAEAMDVTHHVARLVGSVREEPAAVVHLRNCSQVVLEEKPNLLGSREEREGADTI